LLENLREFIFAADGAILLFFTSLLQILVKSIQATLYLSLVLFGPVVSEKKMMRTDSK
jgi:hypothetical protein